MHTQKRSSMIFVAAFCLLCVLACDLPISFGAKPTPQVIVITATPPQGATSYSAIVSTPVSTVAPAPTQTVSQNSSDVYLKPFCNCAENVSAGKRIFVRFAWVAATEALVNDFIQAATYTPVFISSGKPNQKETHWTKPEYVTKDGTYMAYWITELPTLAPGRYNVKTEIHLDRTVTDGFDDNKDGKLDQYGPGVVFEGTIDLTISGSGVIAQLPTEAPFVPTEEPMPYLPPAAPTRVVAAPEMPSSFTDDFSTPRFLSAWDDASCRTYYADGQYHIQVKKQWLNCWSFYPRAYKNLTMEADTTMYSGEGWGGGGSTIIFGATDDHPTGGYYQFAVTRLVGYYRLGQIANGKWVGPDWEKGARLDGPDLNNITHAHLKLVVQGQKAQMYANGNLLKAIDMTGYQGGLIALAGTAYGQDAHVSFDNFKIAALP